MSNSLLRGGENSPTGYGRNEATSARAILPSSKFHRQQQQLFLFLSISIFYILFSSILFYSLLLGYGSVMVRFLRPARRRFRSFSFRKKDDIFQLGFRVGFLLFSRRFSIGFSTAQIRKILFGSSFSHIEKQVFK